MARKSTKNDERPEKVGERVAKVIARAGLGSRRDGEEMIAAGRVAINGTVIDTPAVNVTPGDRITIDGKPLPDRERTRLFLYNKPRGLVTSHNDPEGRPTVFAALPKHLPRLLSIGRLDYNTEGLLLLTNDGGLARVLELPDTGWLRRYRVRAHGEVNQHDLDGLRDGVTVDGMHYGPVEARLDRVQGTNVWITIGIREGKNREVRNVLSHLGLQVTRLIRVSFGPFQLLDLPEGEVEEIKTRILQDQLGEDLAEQAGADFVSPIVEREEGPRRDRRGGSERWPDHSRSEEQGDRRGGDDRGRRGDDRGARRSEGRGDRDDTRRSGPREERRPRGDDRAPRGEGGRFGRDRDERGGDREEARPAKVHRSSSHVWRPHDEEGPRTKRSGAFRGVRREDGTMERPAPTGEKTAGLIADRKGRQVLVERFATPEAEEKIRIPKEPKRFGKGMRREHPADAARRGERTESPRGERSRGGRGERSFRPREDRAEGGRGDRPFRPRGERAEGERSERSFRPRGDRPEGGRGDRPFRPRGEGSEGGRGERPFKPRGERSEGGRGDRPFRPRGEGSEGGRGERPFKPRGARPEGGRGDRPFRPRSEGSEGGRGERPFKPRGERSEGGRGERPFKPRGERSEGGRGDRPFKPRGERSDGGRGERPFRPRSDRPEGGRSERPFRPRGEGAEGGRGERPFKPRRAGSEDGGKRSSGPKREGGFGGKGGRSGPPRGRPSGGGPSGGRPPRSGGPRRPRSE